jgi:hypothetical protein
MMVSKSYRVLSGYVRLAGVIAAAAVFSVMAQSCSKPDDNDLIEEAIKRYNFALVQAYRDLELSPMEPLTTPGHMVGMVSVIQSLRGEGRRLLIVKDSLKVESIKVDGDTAEARTHEKWVFWDEDIETGEVLTPKATEEYRMIYTLKKRDGKWLVDKL